jgi:hypothetical protein
MGSSRRTIDATQFYLGRVTGLGIEFLEAVDLAVATSAAG